MSGTECFEKASLAFPGLEEFVECSPRGGIRSAAVTEHGGSGIFALAVAGREQSVCLRPGRAER